MGLFWQSSAAERCRCANWVVADFRQVHLMRPPGGDLHSLRHDGCLLFQPFCVSGCVFNFGICASSGGPERYLCHVEPKWTLISRGLVCTCQMKKAERY